MLVYMYLATLMYGYLVLLPQSIYRNQKADDRVHYMLPDDEVTLENPLSKGISDSSTSEL